MGFKLIHDGYTDTADCLGLTVTYRPFPIDEWDDCKQALEGKSAKESRQATADLLAERIVSWDAVDEDGKPAEITGENIRKGLSPAQSYRLQDLLLGYTKDGVNQQEADAKNSVTA